MTAALELPRLAGSRDLATRLTADLPAKLGRSRVEVNAESLASVAPSFADELVKQILVNRGARELTVLTASDRFAHYLARSANNRGVRAKLVVHVRYEN